MREVIQLASNCDGGNCPQFKQRTDTGQIGFQAYLGGPEDQMGMPPGEGIVWVDQEELVRLLAKLRTHLAF